MLCIAQSCSWACLRHDSIACGQVITAESQAEVSEAVPLPRESILQYPEPIYGPTMQDTIGTGPAAELLTTGCCMWQLSLSVSGNRLGLL